MSTMPRRTCGCIATITAPHRTGVAMSDDQSTDDNPEQAARRRLDAEQWLRPTEVAILFGEDRFKINRWLAVGHVVIAGKPYPLSWRRRVIGPYREINPHDVAAALTALDAARRAGGATT